MSGCGACRTTEDSGIRIGIYLGDLDRTNNSSHGIINFAIAVTHAAAHNLPERDQLTVIANAQIAAEIGPLPRCEIVVVERPRSSFQRLKLDHVESVRIARERGFDVLYFPKGFTPLRWPRHLTVIATVHDPIPIRYTLGTYGLRSIRPKYVYASLSIMLTLRRANKVSTVSEFSRAQLMRLLIGHREILVVPNAVMELPGSPIEKTRDIVYFGSRLPHKKGKQTYEWLMSVVERADVPVRVTAIGGPPPSSFRFEHLDGLTNDGVREVIASARVVVFNTDFEGFGLPPVEAFSVGTPAIFPAISPLVENLADLPGGFVPDDFDSFVSAPDAALQLSDDALAGYRRCVLERFSLQRQAVALLRMLRDEPSGRADRADG